MSASASRFTRLIYRHGAHRSKYAFGDHLIMSRHRPKLNTLWRALVLALLLLSCARGVHARSQEAYSFTAPVPGIYRVANPFMWSPAETVVCNVELSYWPYYSREEHVFYVYAPAAGTYQLRHWDGMPQSLHIPVQFDVGGKNFYEYSLPNSAISGNWFHHIVEDDSTFTTRVSVPVPLAPNAKASIILCLYNFGASTALVTVSVNGVSNDYQVGGEQEQEITVRCPKGVDNVSLGIYSPLNRIGLIKYVVSNLDNRLSDAPDFSASAYSAVREVNAAELHHQCSDYYGIQNNCLFRLDNSLAPEQAGHRVTGLLRQRKATITNLSLHRVVNVGAQGARGADYVIVTEHRFLQATTSLVASLKGISPTLRYRVVDVQDIYDTYSFSSKSAPAIKRYLRELQPRFVLLLGDANSNPEATNDLIPTFQYEQSERSTSIATDYPYCYSDDAGMPMFALGRLPFVKVEELTAYLSKLQTFLAHPKGKHLIQDDLRLLTKGSLGPGHQRVTYVVPHSEWWKRMLAPDLIDLLNRQQYSSFEFMGHGAFGSWSDQRKIDVTAFKNLRAGCVFELLDLSCWTGEFAHRNKESFSEKLLKLPDSGPISIISASGYTRITSYPHISAYFSLAAQNMPVGEGLTQAKRKLFARNEMTLDDLHAFNLMGLPNLPWR